MCKWQTRDISTRSRTQRTCLSCDYISLHKPLQHTHETRKDNELGEGRPRRLSGREKTAHSWTGCASTQRSPSGAKETALGLWLCSHKRPGRGLSSTTEQADTSGRRKTPNPDLLQNHTTRHQGVMQLKVVKQKQSLAKRRSEFKPLLSLSSVLIRFQLKHYHFFKIILTCNR